jgi:o-succinylbenzoate---CoA ligase
MVSLTDMAATTRRRGFTDLVAYDLPAGEHWLSILAAHAGSGTPFLPVDHRLPAAEKRRLVDRARPAVVVDGAGETVYAAAEPADRERSWAVVATSGTAGRPRLVELPRAAIQTAVDASLAALGLEPGARWIACLSPAHVGGLLVYVRGIMGGSAVSVDEPFDPDRLTGAEAGSNVALVPAMLHRLTRKQRDLSHLGVLLVGGGPVQPALRDAAERLGARVVSTYGMTETCGGIAYDGVVLPGTDVRIAGEGIEVRGPTVMEGYRGDPGATAAAFTLDGWLRTRDAGRLEDDGRLSVLGRLDERIRTGAETVWPEEVEAVLRSDPRVAAVAVAGVADPEWEERVGAWVVPADPTDAPRLEDLRNHCREAGLAPFKIPRELTLVERLPRTPGGKLRRSALVARPLREG